VGVSVLHNITGGQVINGTEKLIISIPVLGGSGAPSLIMGGSTIIYNNASTPLIIPAAVPSGNCSAILPVDLLSFKANKKTSKTSLLQWETASEKNIVNYIIERSDDGRNFHAIGFIKPKAGSANEKTAYDFLDEQPEMGLNYYRLLSKGFGKDEKYSKVVSLDFGLGLIGRAYPNPIDGDITIDLDIEGNSGEVLISMFDIVGKQVLTKKVQNTDRRVNFTMPTSDLVPGIYLIRVSVGGFKWEHKITKF
jgi:hypothetical protein